MQPDTALSTFNRPRGLIARVLCQLRAIPNWFRTSRRPDNEPSQPEPGETFRCAHCTGEHVASTEIGEWLTYTDPEMMEGVVQAGGRYPIA